MPIIRWKPEDLQESYQDESETAPLTTELSSELYEENGNVIVKVNTEGINPTTIDIEAHDQYLRISGTRDHETHALDTQEQAHEFFERIFELPCEVMGSQARAEMHNNILTIVLPKKSSEQFSENLPQSKPI